MTNISYPSTVLGKPANLNFIVDDVTGILYGYKNIVTNVDTAISGGGSSSTPVTTIASSGASQALAFPASGSACYDVTLTANCTFTLTGGTAGQYQRVTLILRQDATAGRVATLPSGVKWTSGVTPTPNTVAGKIDVFYFHTPDAGTTVLGGY